MMVHEEDGIQFTIPITDKVELKTLTNRIQQYLNPFEWRINEYTGVLENILECLNEDIFTGTRRA